MKRENDSEFFVDDSEPVEVMIKAGLAETIEIPLPEVKGIGFMLCSCEIFKNK